MKPKKEGKEEKPTSATVSRFCAHRPTEGSETDENTEQNQISVTSNGTSGKTGAKDRGVSPVEQ